MNVGQVEDALGDPEEGRGQGTDHWQDEGNLQGKNKSESNIIQIHILAISPRG